MVLTLKSHTWLCPLIFIRPLASCGMSDCANWVKPIF